MKRLLAWLFYQTGYVPLVLPERIQGQGEGPWGEASNLDGNQFDARFSP